VGSAAITALHGDGDARRRSAGVRQASWGTPQPYFCVQRGIGASWRKLPAPVRWYLRNFLFGKWPGTRVTVALPDAPDRLISDVRTAFPGVIRRLVEVQDGDRLAFGLECEALHEGVWRGIVRPTGRYVVFEERHSIELRDGRVCVDHATLDASAILRQLCTP
jgi:hypothetical protein